MTVHETAPTGRRRDVVVMSLAIFGLIAGEQLWTRFLPARLAALGAPAIALGLWGSIKDFIDATLQYPGGVLSDRLGNQRALMLFTAVAGAGYVAYLLAPSWHWLFLGLVLATAWGSLASPAMFALIAESLPSRERARGFLLQSVLRRVPIVFAPVLGGLLITALGLAAGLQTGFAISIGLALVTLWFQWRFYHAPPRPAAAPRQGLVQLWNRAGGPLRRLLLADILARVAESMADVFVVLYVLQVVGLGAVHFGAWVGLQAAVSIVSYFPGAWLAERLGRKPVITITFLMFALFPLMVGAARDWLGLTVAFVIAGLRELGEPARKASIVDASPPDARGQTVGAYYLARSVAILPAGIIGGWLWSRDPHLPFWLAGAVGLAGVLYFVLAYRERPST